MHLQSVPDLLQTNGLFYLLVIVGIFPAGRQILEGFGKQLALAIPRASHGFIKLEDGVAHLHARTLTLSL